MKQENVDTGNRPADDNAPEVLRPRNKNHRKVYRERFRQNRDDGLPERKIDNGEEMDDHNHDNDDEQGIRKRNVL
jgi:hypothetical protein